MRPRTRFSLVEAQEQILNSQNAENDDIALDSDSDIPSESESESDSDWDDQDADGFPCVIVGLDGEQDANDNDRIRRDLHAQNIEEELDSDGDEADDDEEIESDAGDGILPGPGPWASPELNWRQVRGAQGYQPADLEFRPTENPGLRVDTSDFSALDYFQLFIGDDLLNHYVSQTNLYGDQYIDGKENLAKYALGRGWKEDHTDRDEMKQFIGLILLMGLVRKPTIPMYWAKDPLYDTPLFRNVMPRNRFQTLLKFWHFNDSTGEPDRASPDRDRIYKIRPVVDHLFEHFQLAYVPEKQLAVDESLLLWKGRLLFRQYIPLKRARFGIKLFCACAKSGYTYRFRIYTGKEDPATNYNQVLPGHMHEFGKTEKVVLHLLLPLLDQGYHVFMDNWFTSSHLYMYLHHRSTLATGTARSNRVPKGLRAHRLKEVGDLVAFAAGPILSQKFKVSLMHTCNDTLSLEISRFESLLTKYTCT